MYYVINLQWFTGVNVGFYLFGCAIAKVHFGCLGKCFDMFTVFDCNTRKHNIPFAIQSKKVYTQFSAQFIRGFIHKIFEINSLLQGFECILWTGWFSIHFGFESDHRVSADNDVNFWFVFCFCSGIQAICHFKYFL